MILACKIIIVLIQNHKLTWFANTTFYYRRILIDTGEPNVRAIIYKKSSGKDDKV